MTEKIDEKSKPILQYRWKIDYSNQKTKLIYYGLHNFPKQNMRGFCISDKTVSAISKCDGKTELGQILKSVGLDAFDKEILRLIDEKIIVPINDLRIPATLEKYQRCVKCVNNDYILPGLEFDAEGVCAFCQCYEKVKGKQAMGGTVSTKKLVDSLKGNKSRFDVLVLYTGGKDSSYLLYHLANNLNLRVLACTWDMPFMNESTLQNIARAKQKFDKVEFISRTIPNGILQNAFKILLDEFGLPCVCHILAYVLFYPLASQEKIPFIMDGVEAAQTLILTKVLDPPSEKELPELNDKESSLLMLKNLLYVKGKPDDVDTNNYFLQRVRELLEPIYMPLKEIVENTEDHYIPFIKRLDSETEYGTWSAVADVITREIGWKMPKNQKGLLHTSCFIETYKDFLQLKNFRQMLTPDMPQSIIELGAAVYCGQITREDAEVELAERGYFGKPKSIDLLLDNLGLNVSSFASKRSVFYSLMNS